MPAGDLTIKIARSLRGVDASAWDACANPAVDAPRAADAQGERFNPFLTHAFLAACEDSGSATPRTGWAGAHVLIEDAHGLAGVAPCYLKSHSMGEYVFDYSWADAFERAGGNYYPKLQVCVPFTPVTGARLLVRDGLDGDRIRNALIEGLRALRDANEASSINVTFPNAQDHAALGKLGFLQRTGKQFHFFNRDYATFDAFLAALSSRKRKMIRKERAQAVENGITIERLTGATLKDVHWDAFFRFYMDTGARKWGQPYLTRKFFTQIGATMPDRVLLVMAKREGQYIAGAINFIGDDALYGRNWGAVEHHPCLHFEVCYYQAIDFAIERKLARVEAGAQGEHKLARGYEPMPTYSAHDIADPRLRRAIADFVARERMAVAEEIDEYAEHVPFRKGDGAAPAIPVDSSSDERGEGVR